jgi:putative membrane protein
MRRWISRPDWSKGRVRHEWPRWVADVQDRFPRHETGHAQPNIAGLFMSDVLAVWASLLAGLPVFLLQLAVTTALWLAALALAYVLAFWRIGSTSDTARHSLSLVHGGEALALALPLAACLAGSITAADILMWGMVVVLVQLAWSLFSAFAMRGTVRRAGEGEMPAAAQLVIVRLGFSLLNAAAISG